MSLFQSALPVNGLPAPSHITGRYYPPQLVSGDSATASTTATRLYYIPYFITEIRSYAGFVMRNTGTGDPGEKCRMGLYTHGAGGPTTLVQAATEVTFSSSAADNVTANAFTPTYVGWHWICAQFDSASTVYAFKTIGQSITAAGDLPSLLFNTHFGISSVAAEDWGVAINPGSALYVDTTYAALASTAVAPTATIPNAATNVCPFIALVA